MSLRQLTQELNHLGSKKRAQTSAWFFKTGAGQYGYGDKFIGITVPVQRQVAKKYLALSLAEIQKLLNSKIHEYRLVGLMILVAQFNQANQTMKQKIYDFYLKNSKKVNNWDLVDLSAPNIVGQFLFSRSRASLYQLAKSKNLWQKRIAIVATYYFIKRGDLKDTFRISKSLLRDKHDLIHKAVGWMLREAGKRDQKTLERFLQKQIKIIPRTTLRYAIEKFSETKRQSYLKK